MSRKPATPIATKRTRADRASRREAGEELLQVWLCPGAVKALARLAADESKAATINRLIIRAATKGE